VAGWVRIAGRLCATLTAGSAGDLYEILITLLPRPSRIPTRLLTRNRCLDGTGFLKLDGAKEQNLVITDEDEPAITVDNIKVAQFIYLLLHNEKIREVIDTIGKKGVLLLGRFTEGRMVVLERLREKLRDLGFVPMVFNFDKQGQAPRVDDNCNIIGEIKDTLGFSLMDE